MIVFDLQCSDGHRFEGWFGSSGDFSDQQNRGLLSCPLCSNAVIEKAPMAPSVPAKANAQSGPETRAPMATGQMPLEVTNALKAIAKAQAKALASSTWVGEKFADRARSMHYGEVDPAPIHGQATRDQAESMLSEGIAVAPLLFPVAPPEEVN